MNSVTGDVNTPSRRTDSKNIAVAGGTFGPMTEGAIDAIVAGVNELRDRDIRVDELLLVPAGNPWQKADRVRLPYDFRCDLLRLIAPELERRTGVRVAVSDAAKPQPKIPGKPITRPEDAKPTYDIDTYEELSGRYSSGAEFYPILGADAFAGITSWHRWKDLVSLLHFVVVSRPGTSLLRTQASVEAAVRREGIGFDATYVEADTRDSSTTQFWQDIRGDVERALTMVPEVMRHPLRAWIFSKAQSLPVPPSPQPPVPPHPSPPSAGGNGPAYGG